MSFSNDVTKPLSNQPAACKIKFAPPMTVECILSLLSAADCASGSFEAVKLPPQRKGTFKRLAN